jgi:hypothetical protein
MSSANNRLPGMWYVVFNKPKDQIMACHIHTCIHVTYLGLGTCYIHVDLFIYFFS